MMTNKRIQLKILEYQTTRIKYWSEMVLCYYKHNLILKYFLTL